MDPIILTVNDSDRQSRTISITPNDKTISLRVELRYLYRTDKWYMSITDGITGESLVQYVPLVAGIYETANNLLAQFGYKEIGSAWVLPKDEKSSLDPAYKTLDDFLIVWGDAV